VPGGKTGLGQSSLTGLGSELAQNPDSNAVPSRRSVWPFRQRSGGSRSYLLHCRVPAIEAIVARDATIRADLQDALEVSFHDSAPLDSWRRFPKPPSIVIIEPSAAATVLGAVDYAFALQPHCDRIHQVACPEVV
jgi:hypothetical protein